MSLRVLAGSVVKPLRGLRKRHFSAYRHPALSWAASQAALLRRLMLHRTTFIGITGSCGKTTTTELTGKILSAKGPCHVKSSGNTHSAALRSILSIAPSDRFCVHEVAASGPGTIGRVVRILRPRIAIVTTIGTDHYRLFRGLEATAREKAALVAALPKSGTAILNADDPHVRAMAPLTRAHVLTYGLSPDADVRATNVSSLWPQRLSLDVMHGSQRVRIQTKLAGEYWVTSILSAIACGIVCGMRIEDCTEAIEQFEPVFARWSIHSKPGKPVFILDTRKAPSWTLPHSLDFIERARAPRKTILFGTLCDRPGAWTGDRYRKLAQQALEVADRVMFVGPNAGRVDRLRTGEVAQRLLSFPTAYQAGEFVARNALPDELILVKASISDHLERVMLRMQDSVVCWRERCRRPMNCPECRLYCTPHPPSFSLDHPGGMAERSKTAAAASPMEQERC